jgi:hypothetical protein
MLVVAAKRDEKFVNERLRVAAACAFANINAFCIGRNECHDLVGNKAVMNHNLRR